MAYTHHEASHNDDLLSPRKSLLFVTAAAVAGWVLAIGLVYVAYRAF